MCAAHNHFPSFPFSSLPVHLLTLARCDRHDGPPKAHPRCPTVIVGGLCWLPSLPTAWPRFGLDFCPTGSGSDPGNSAFGSRTRTSGFRPPATGSNVGCILCHSWLRPLIFNHPDPNTNLSRGAPEILLFDALSRSCKLANKRATRHHCVLGVLRHDMPPTPAIV